LRSVRSLRGKDLTDHCVYVNHRFNIFRKELFSAQARLSETAATIRHIEVINMKDQKLARALKRKHAIMDQQNQMKQQKESQFLREIQLCKTRQLQQVL
jgi:hypothetical protein